MMMIILIKICRMKILSIIGMCICIVLVGIVDFVGWLVVNGGRSVAVAVAVAVGTSSVIKMIVVVIVLISESSGSKMLLVILLILW